MWGGAKAVPSLPLLPVRKWKLPSEACEAGPVTTPQPSRRSQTALCPGSPQTRLPPVPPPDFSPTGGQLVFCPSSLAGGRAGNTWLRRPPNPTGSGGQSASPACLTTCLDAVVGGGRILRKRGDKTAGEHHKVQGRTFSLLRSDSAAFASQGRSKLLPFISICFVFPPKRPPNFVLPLPSQVQTRIQKCPSAPPPQLSPYGSFSNVSSLSSPSPPLASFAFIPWAFPPACQGPYLALHDASFPK